MNGRLARAEVPWLAAIVLIAVALRLAWIWYATADPTDGRFDDSVFYHHVAAFLADGGGYNSPWSGLPTAQWAPGYPFFLTPLYWIFGPNVTVAELANVVLGAATVGVLFLLALQLFDSRTARVAALLLALFPGQILFASLLYSETLFTFLFTLALLLAVVAGKRTPAGGWQWLVAFGLVAGAAALVRGAGLSLLLIAPAYWALTWRDGWMTLRWSGLAVVVAALLILPWTVRNIQTMDAPLIITSSTGINFWQGHHAGASGSDDEFPRELTEEYGPLNKPGAEVAISNAGFREGVRFLVRNPGEEVRLIGRKVRALYFDGDLIALDIIESNGLRPFVSSRVNSVLRPVTNVFYYSIFLFAAVALARWAFQPVRNNALILPLIAIAVLTVGHVVLFMGGPRYHFPLVPLFCLLAGWTFTSLFAGRLRGADRLEG